MSGDLPRQLRAIGGYHWGTDLHDRVATAVAWQKRQAELMAQAADEIERLRAELTARDAVSPRNLGE